MFNIELIKLYLATIKGIPVEKITRTLVKTVDSQEVHTGDGLVRYIPSSIQVTLELISLTQEELAAMGRYMKTRKILPRFSVDNKPLVLNIVKSYISDFYREEMKTIFVIKITESKYATLIKNKHEHFISSPEEFWQEYIGQWVPREAAIPNPYQRLNRDTYLGRRVN